MGLISVNHNRIGTRRTITATGQMVAGMGTKSPVGLDPK